MVADPKSADTFADLCHNAGILVAEHNRRMHLCTARLAVIDMDIRAADTAGIILYNDSAGLRFGNWAFPHFKCLIAHKACSFHNSSLLYE